MDPALLDRFHVHLRLTAGPDRTWFVERFGAENWATPCWIWYETDLDESSRAA